jgi:sigma-B regulation protein RsbU (phosphoserine phosphatase)
MARAHDWITLAKSTFSSLKKSDMTGLYQHEWPHTREMLIGEHKEDIDRDPKSWRRWMRSTSAVLYGLTRRLAPHRRVIFAACWIYFFICLISLWSLMRHPPLLLFVEITAAFLLLTVLLAFELIDKIRFRDELELARDLQAGLIPKVMPITDDYEIAAFNEIANTVGGDIYDFVPLPDGRLAVLFGDASGHGMAAGLVMAVAHASFRTQLETGAEPATVVPALNRILCRTGGPRSFFASCYLLFEKGGDYVAVLAGHPPIVKVTAEGKIAERIGRGAYPLGIKTGLVWEEVRGHLEPGEKLLFHSDGLTEARNPNGREFGDSYVDAIVGWNSRASATTLLDTLVSEWRMFTANQPPEDDVSIAVIARK